MGQSESQPRLKITNKASKVVDLLISDYNEKVIHQVIAPNGTFTLETCKGLHTITVYPLGTTSFIDAKAQAHYDYEIYREESFFINQKDEILTISRQRGESQKEEEMDTITNNTDETILIVFTHTDQKMRNGNCWFFDQVLLPKEVYKFQAAEGKKNISVYRLGEEDYKTTYSFYHKRAVLADKSFMDRSSTEEYFHLEASITKVGGKLNTSIAHIQHGSYTYVAYRGR